MNRIVTSKCGCLLGRCYLQTSGRLSQKSGVSHPVLRNACIGRRARYTSSSLLSSANVNNQNCNHISTNKTNIHTHNESRTHLRREHLLHATTIHPNARFLSTQTRQFSIWNWNGNNDGFSPPGDNSSGSNGDNNGNDDSSVGGGEGNGGASSGNGGNGGASSGGNGGDGSSNPLPPAGGPPRMMSLTSITVPEIFTPIPVIAVNRSPVFPKFIKILEVSMKSFFEKV